ncbi:hypothetical protein AST03_06860 [Staphylococcus equorum]|uniref:coiled-coil domain-containing protein n=1 Tax=Staphylococcus equorum TaxID=246432 RepID=UPI000852ED2D|nr:hypothetical protein [Staphylococcus equorum]OEK79678.1 hypothetical protein AST03_06860 [Staphylococcus equorum]
MQKSKAIKELFKIQDTTQKFEIIKKYDLNIKGFSNITMDILKQNEKYISNQITSTQNISKINSTIKSSIKAENNLDYLLSPEKIIEKYNYDFKGLLTIFENDQYSELTEIMIDKITMDTTQVNTNNSNEDDSKKETLRNIIKSLELKLQNREEKIQVLLKNSKEINRKIDDYRNQIDKLNEKITKNHNDLETKNESIQIKKVKINELKEKLEIQKSNTLYLEDTKKASHNKSIHIMGAPELWKSEKLKNVEFYNEKNTDLFIQKSNKHMVHKFYIVKFGVTSYTSRKLKKLMNVTFIDSKEDFAKILEED